MNQQRIGSDSVLKRISRCLGYVLPASIFILSATALLINYFIYQYPGNNYFPDSTLLMLAALSLTYAGSVLYFDKHHRLAKIILELLCLVGIMSLICLAATAIQFTPFPPIDASIVAIERYFHINMIELLAWTHQHPSLEQLMGLSYDFLTYQMCVIPIFLILIGKKKRLQGYYFILLFTTLFGFSFYYFYPTTAPASILESPYFTAYEQATGLKFYQIHHYMVPTTLEGGLIAFPSFHAIWALCCVYLLKDWPVAGFLLFIINAFMLIACVFLGWHYVLDIIAGVALFALGYRILKYTQPSLGSSEKFEYSRR